MRTLIRDFLHELRIAARRLLRRPTFLILASAGLGLSIAVTAAAVGMSMEAGGTGREIVDPKALREVLRLASASCSPECVEGFGESEAAAIARRASRAEAVAVVELARLSLGPRQDSLVSGLIIGPEFATVLRPEDKRVTKLFADVGNGSSAVVISEALARRLTDANGRLPEALWISGVPVRILGTIPNGARYPFNADVWISRGVRAPESAKVRYVLLRGADGLGLGGPSRYVPSGGEGSPAAIIRPLRGQDGESPTRFLALGCALLLIVACVNLAGLFVARGIDREQTFAVYDAIGAGTWRLALAMFMEPLIVAGAGGAIGIATAVFGRHAFAAAAGWLQMPATSPAPVAHVVGIATLLAGVCASAGLGASWIALRPSMVKAAHRSSRTSSSRGAATVRRLVVGSQVAAAVACACGAAACVTSFERTQRIPLPFDPRRVAWAMAEVPPTVTQADTLRLLAAADSIASRTLRIAGVMAATVWSESYPRAPAPAGRERMEIDGEGPVSIARTASAIYGVDASFPQVFRLRIIAGHWPAANGDGDSLVVVNRVAARLWWRGEAAIGRHIRFGHLSSNRWLTVAAVVEDQGVGEKALRTGLFANVQLPNVYVSRALMPPGRLRVAAEAATVNEALLGSVEGVLRGANLRVAEPGPTSLYERMIRSGDLGSLRANARLLSFLAVLVAAIGVLGVASSARISVAQRMRELAIRAAIGAPASHLLGVVLRPLLITITLGGLAGLVVGWVAVTSSSKTLVGYTPEWIQIGGGVFVTAMAVGAMMASWAGRHAISVDPGTLLRNE